MGTTGIKNNKNALESVVVYPNPSTGIISIDLKQSEIVVIQIINSLGQTVKSTQVKDRLLTIDMSIFPAGIYSIQIQGKEGVIHKKVQLLD